MLVTVIVPQWTKTIDTMSQSLSSLACSCKARVRFCFGIFFLSGSLRVCVCDHIIVITAVAYQIIALWAFLK